MHDGWIIFYPPAWLSPFFNWDTLTVFHGCIGKGIKIYRSWYKPWLNQGILIADGNHRDDRGLTMFIWVIKTYQIWLVVWNMAFMTFQKSWECHHPNWLSYFSEGLKPPTRNCCLVIEGCHYQIGPNTSNGDRINRWWLVVTCGLYHLDKVWIAKLLSSTSQWKSPLTTQYPSTNRMG